jgi:WD40-like Beta Propeller Repeat
MFNLFRNRASHCLAPAGIVGAMLCALLPLNARTRPLAPYDPGTSVSEPRVFAPGIISTDLDESGGTFSPDGRDFYFTLLAPYTTNPHLGVLCVSHFQGGVWQEPQILPFSGKSLDFGPRLSADGTRLYFASIRPVPSVKQPHFRIWVAQKTGQANMVQTWGEPTPVAAPINQDDSDNVDPALTPRGDLYFASNRRDPAGHFHIYFAPWADGKFQEPEKLGREINSEFSESSPAISPDGKLLVFASTAAPEDPERRRPQDLIAAGKPYPRQDLYLSVKRNGHWTPAKHLEHGINSSAEEVYPDFSPDGKFLFWGSERSGFQIPTHRLDRAEVENLWTSPLNGRGNIYFIRVKALGVNP